MELREYFKIIGRYWKVFWGIVVLAVLGTLIFTKMQPKSYLASTTITVNKASALKQSQVNYYLFDNYYNVQSSGLFSQIVTSWFSSPALVSEIYQKAGLAIPAVSQNKLGKIFKAARAEPATINVSVVDSDKAQAEKLISAASQVMQDKTNELGKADPENVYDIFTFSPIITDNNPSLWLNLTIGLIAGLIFGAIVSIAADYFKK